MASVNQKYLKDEQGNKISPVTSVNSVYDTDGNSLGGGYCTNWYGITIYS